jgi:hypothetical protein|tara:strand:- start:559 stop:765 length:207 start_codon:yes stop_codon:yes gene_type:complete
MINGYVKSKMFYWIMGVALIILMAILGYMNGKLDKTSEIFNHNVTEIKVQVAEIKTDLRLLRQELKVR